MNYLITGGRGFIGCQTIRQLLKQGHHVTCICHDLNKTSMHEVLTEEEIERVELIPGEITNQELIVDIIKDRGIDNIIHLAAVLGDIAERNPAEAVQVNILGTISIFEAAVATGVRRVVWASSQSIFASAEFYEELYHLPLVPNDAVLKPKLMYGATKVFCEFLGEWYYENHGLETIGLRYTMVFGPARQRGIGQFATELMNKPALGEKGTVSFGETAPNWIYVEDAARATVIASQCPNPQTRNFTIGGDTRSLADLRDYVLTLLPDAEIELLPGTFPAAYNLDVSAAERELGFKCEYSVEQGAHKVINLLREHEGLPLV